MDLAARELDPFLPAHIDIREVGDKDHVVVADRRAQEQWAAAREQQLERGKIAGAVIVQPLFFGFSPDHVAVLIEDAERVPMLEHAQWTSHPLCVGQDGELIVELQHIRHKQRTSDPRETNVRSRPARWPPWH